MSSFHVAPFIPVFEEEASSYVSLDLVCFGLLVFFLIAAIVIAVGMDLRSENNPLSVRRPKGCRCSCRNFCNLLLVISVAIHRPKLTARNKCDLLPVRRPARRTRRTLTVC